MKGKIARSCTTLAVLTLVVGACGLPGDSGGGGGKVQVVYAGFGGSVQAAEEEAYIKPFEEAHPDIDIVYDPTADQAKLRAMVESGNVTWDVAAIGNIFGLSETDTKYLTEIDCAVVACSDLQPDKYPTNGYRMPYQTAGVALAYNPSKMPPGQTPQGWADYFDTAKFPGRRISMNSVYSYVLEPALVASGVPKDQLYPLDIDRALGEWDKIANDVTFTENYQTCAEAVATGDAAMGLCWTGRIYNAAQSGSDIAVQWNGTTLNASYVGIPRGTKHSKEANEFIAFITSPEVQANFANLLPYGPSTTESEPMINPEIKPWLGSTHEDEAIFVSDQWWADNLDSALQRWQSWLTK